MARSRFEYFSPETLKEAIDILLKYDNARVMAGGTDLLLRLKEGAIKAEAVVGLKKIKELNNLATTNLHIGQVLTVHAGKTPPPVVAGLATYKVRPGDNPFLFPNRNKLKLKLFSF